MSKLGAAEELADEPLTAVLLADSFSTKMRPITTERPKALLPLANAPIIEYALETLDACGVRIAYVVCASHADQIRAYLDRSVKLRHCNLEIRPVVSYNCVSAGEAMRLVDQEGLIGGDFILFSCDAISNMDLAAAMAEHRARRAKDKSAIMTIVATGGMNTAVRVQRGLPDLSVALDPTTKRLLALATLDDAGPDGTVAVDTTFFSDRDTLTVRADMDLPGIYICAPEVLMLFSDNFDYQNVERDFIRGVLSEEELGKKLFLHELTGGGYAARVTSLRAYASITRDVLLRWAEPLCPDVNLLPEAGPTRAAGADGDGDGDWAPCYMCLREKNLYEEATVQRDPSVQVGETVCIGARSTLGAGTYVTRSVIGPDCRIGTSVRLSHSFIMNNVVIGDGATVEDAMICDGAVIGAHARVGRGAVISFRCVIAPGHAVPPHARVTLCAAEASGSEDSDIELEAPTGRTGALDADADGDARLPGPLPAALKAAEHAAAGVAPDESLNFDASAVGAGGAGYAHSILDAVSTPSQLEQLTSIALPGRALAAQRNTVLGAQGDGAARREVDDEEEGESGGVDADPEASFKREVSETLLRTMALADGKQDATMADNAVIELNALKIAEVRTFADCARYVLTTLMDLQAPAASTVALPFRGLFAAHAADAGAPAGQRALVAGLRRTLQVWAPTLRKLLHGAEDAYQLLVTLEEYCGEAGVFAGLGARGRLFVPVFSHVLTLLYDFDLVDEDVFLEWEEDKRDDDEDDQEFLVRAKQFLDWLRAAESEEVSDSGDDVSDSGKEEGETGGGGSETASE